MPNTKTLRKYRQRARRRSEKHFHQTRRKGNFTEEDHCGYYRYMRRYCLGFVRGHKYTHCVLCLSHASAMPMMPPDIHDPTTISTHAVIGFSSDRRRIYLCGQFSGVCESTIDLPQGYVCQVCMTDILHDKHLTVRCIECH